MLLGAQLGGGWVGFLVAFRPAYSGRSKTQDPSMLVSVLRLLVLRPAGGLSGFSQPSCGLWPPHLLILSAKHFNTFLNSGSLIFHSPQK